MPSINAVGTNTALSTSAIATSAPCTCDIAFFVASRGERPPRMLRSTFSTTTIASSTTIPIASTSPNSERLFIEKPKQYMKKNVPTSDTGIANMGMTAALHDCKNSIITNTTSATASNIVRYTASMDCCMYSVMS